MKLMERYIQEVGQLLPKKNRSAILAKLRSDLEDALASKADGQPTKGDVAVVLKEFGPPKEVAASYYPEGQYLIGPALYPLFLMVIGIVLAAVIGSQLLAMAIGLLFHQEAIDPAQVALGLLNSMTVASVMVVIVFSILQRFDVRPELLDSKWNPDDLLQIDTNEKRIKRGERIISIVATVALLVWLLIYQEHILLVFTSGWHKTFTNPVVGRYLLLIALSLLFGIGLDIFLLWQGRWSTTSRLLKITTNLFSIIVLFLLVQGHTVWLTEQGATSFFEMLGQLPSNLAEDGQIVGMQAFHFGLTIALVVYLIETAVIGVRFTVRRTIHSIKQDPVVINLKKG